MNSPINLQLGWPSPRLFPTKQLAKAATASILDPKIAASALIYGPDLGYAPLRESIANWLSEFYSPSRGAISTDRIAITGGASQNLASILHVFTDPTITQIVWMVEPTYFLACAIFQDAGFADRLRGVPENERGLDIEFLKNALAKFESEINETASTKKLKPAEQYSKIYRHVLYLTPTFSNPSGKTISLPIREQLIALARQYDVLVISDDVYDFLRWTPEVSDSSKKLATMPPRFVDVDRAIGESESWGNSISNGSFSKIIAPGVRVGWAEGSPKMILRLSQNGATRSGGAPSHLTSTFIHHMITSGDLQSHINNVLIPIYSTRYRCMMSAIKTHLEPLGVCVTVGAPYTIPGSSDVVVPAGGFFTYIMFPAELPTADIIARKAREEYGLTFAYGEMFVVKGDKSSAERAKTSFDRGARLCWAWHEGHVIEDGIARLATLLKTMLKEAKWT
ncbi:pyridoxal phosphate-dependent transferase [Bisporella sp. PMI_857]|nr:pyridoxal phosphate-dependent transferase [Bisporella sp. PMI_857]